MRHGALHIAQVDVGHHVHALGVFVGRGDGVAAHHFLNGAEAHFEGVVVARFCGEQAVVEFRFVDEAGLRAHAVEGRIVGVGGEAYAGLFGHGDDFLQEAFQSAPEFLMRDFREDAFAGFVVPHVPHHALLNRGGVDLRNAVHDDALGVAAGGAAGHAAGHAGEREVVADDGDAGFADIADHLFDLFDLLCALRAIQEDVVPVRGIEVLDGVPAQAGGLDFAAQFHEIGDLPDFVGVARQAPAVETADGLVLRGLVALVEVVDQVHDEVRRAALDGEVVMLAVEHVSVESKAEFHEGGV